MSETLQTPSSSAVVEPQPQPAKPARRLMSLDALRGFDMFWISGGDSLFQALYAALPVAPFFVLHQQLEHKDWQGLAFYDLIFPLFIFIVGVSIVLSLSRVLEQGGRKAAIKRILIRGLLLYVIGLFLYGGVSKGFENIRWLGVLQRIAICYTCAALIFLVFRVRGMVVICLAILLGYWGVTRFVPVRDFNLQTAQLKARGLEPRSEETRRLFLATTTRVTGKYEDGLNLPNHLDYQYLPGFKWDGAYDPEGLLSTPAAVVTCLLGVFTGLYLRNHRASDQRKVLVLLGVGLVGVFLGFLWGTQFPVIKKIWTSSYVLAAAGYSCIFLAIFHQIIEVWGWRKWCTPFVWIGMNAITIYIVARIVKFDNVARLFVGGPIEKSLGSAGQLVVSVVAMLFVLALLRFLYNRKIFLRL